MTRIATAAAIVSALAFSACGPGAKISGNKEAVASALFAATQPTKASSDKSGGGADLTADISVNCAEGGTARLSGFSAIFNGGLGSLNVGQKFTLTYNACGLAKSDYGVALYNGSMTVEQTLGLAGGQGAGGSVNIDQKLKGKILVQGAFDDFIDADVTQKVQAAALGTGSGTVGMTLVGSVITSNSTQTYNEEVNVTAGKIAAEIAKR